MKTSALLSVLSISILSFVAGQSRSAEACSRYPATNAHVASSSVTASSILVTTEDDFAVYDQDGQSVALTPFLGDARLLAATNAFNVPFKFFKFAQSVTPGDYQTSEGRSLTVIAEANFNASDHRIAGASASLTLGVSSCICSYSVFSTNIHLEDNPEADSHPNFLLVFRGEDSQEASRYVRSLNFTDTHRDLVEIPSLPELGGLDAQAFCVEVSTVSHKGELSSPVTLGCFDPTNYKPVCHDPGGCSATPPGDIPVMLIFALIFGATRIYRRRVTA